MPQIILTDEQARVIASALEPIQMCDTQGNVLCFIPPIWTAADIADAQRRLTSDEPRRTTAEVLEHLRTLDPK